MLPRAQLRPLLRRSTSGAQGWPVLTAEALAALGVAAFLLAAGAALRLDPLTRIAQVSILARLQLSTLVVVGVLMVLLLAARRWPLASGVLTRTAWAGTSGVVSGVVAGGLAAGLHGATLPLNGLRGDSGQLVGWAQAALDGGSTVPPSYAPGPVWAITALSRLLDLAPAESLGDLQVLVTAVVGPLAYLAWRTVVSSPAAAAISLTATAPFLDPYKPFTSVSLVVAVPLFVRVVRMVRDGPGGSWWRQALCALALGALLGLVFLVYSGWFLWYAPGLAVTAAHAWWSGPRGHRPVLVLAGVAVGFLGVTWSYLSGALAAGPVADDYQYQDTRSDPAVFATWFGDSPVEPPQTVQTFGVLAGVDVATVLVLVGAGLAVACCWTSWVVRTLMWCLAGAWVLRLWYAGQMVETGLVQLYPRTSTVLLHASIVMSTLVALHLLRAVLRWARTRGHSDSSALARYVAVGVVVTALLSGFLGSATADRYLPRDDLSVARMAWRAHTD
ncbi:hypothetical protein [Actinotalea sp. Marseille-Q4924]|uniref:hypothetical protein n=1 Tax=Actinotalea sp. Marseille-Q4924 TaxID=2866571 RepID=UPI001CE3BF9F|nr:hypothetical protein [Actinotalea sp. Marseille-Q4924]